MNLKDFFLQNKEVAVAVSGGVDSAVVLSEAVKYADRVSAYFAKSAFQPEFELTNAKKICAQFNVRLNVININVFDNQDIIKNNADRCYYCKKTIFSNIKEQANADGFHVIIDGTNASDNADDRPGMKVLKEMHILSPLRICNIHKKDVRKIAKDNLLPVYDLPSYSCLATRITQNTAITKEILNKIEKSEECLFNLGFKGFRIRYLNGDAKIEVEEKDIKNIVDKKDEILNLLNPYFKNIFLDLKVRGNE